MSRTFLLSHPDLSGTFHFSLNSLGCVLLSVHHVLIVSSLSVSDVFHMVLRFGEIPMIVTFHVSTLIWTYLIDVGDFSLICPFQVRLFLMNRVFGFSSCDGCVWWAVFDLTHRSHGLRAFCSCIILGFSGVFAFLPTNTSLTLFLPYSSYYNVFFFYGSCPHCLPVRATSPSD